MLLTLLGCGIAIVSSCGNERNQDIRVENDYPIRPVLFTSVKLTDDFWAPRIKTNHEVTIPFTLDKCRTTGRIKNFRIAAGLETGSFCTDFTFDDTDIYKILEGACYSLQIYDDPALEASVDSLIELVGMAQEDDGYIFTNRTIMGDSAHEWSGSERWEKVHELSHELYNIGHLIESAVAHYHATGKKNYLDIAIKAADRVCEDFGPGRLESYPGHQIIELALAKLYRATGDEKYLETGKFLLDVRGPGGDEYNQAHKKVVDQEEAVGHAVRATYMYAGMADIAALKKDSAYIKAIDRIWEDVVSGKLYLTGGIGATGHGEAFGEAYDLPNMSAYCETCASIANVYWNYRLFLLHGDAKYFDVLERTLYNAFLSGVSLEGDRFFYPNPLESHGQHERSPWFSCACCPGNVTRFVPSVPGYFYATKDQSVYVNLFAESNATLTIGNNTITLDQQTNYPCEGDVSITVNPEQAAEFEVLVRIPGWAIDQPLPGDLYRFADQATQQPRAFLNDEEVALTLKSGYLSLKRTWEEGDQIRIQLPVTARKVIAHEQVAADRNKVAVQRGPLVYCAEWPDQKDGRVLNLMIDQEAELTGDFDQNLLKGVYVLNASGSSIARSAGDKLTTEPTNLTLIPYYAWAHRGAGEMMVWIPDTVSAARPLPAPTIASMSKISASHKTRALKALNDQMEPENSGDRSIIYYHWWPKQDTVQWVQYDFEKPARISSAKVYWYDDGPFGGCRIPAGWKLMYKNGDKWEPVKNSNEYKAVKDRYSSVNFQPVTTTALRMKVVLPKEHSSGIMEWIVN